MNQLEVGPHQGLARRAGDPELESIPARVALLPGNVEEKAPAGQNTRVVVVLHRLTGTLTGLEGSAVGSVPGGDNLGICISVRCADLYAALVECEAVAAVIGSARPDPRAPQLGQRRRSRARNRGGGWG